MPAAYDRALGGRAGRIPIDPSVGPRRPRGPLPLTLRVATPADADLIAWVQVEASRSNAPLGFWDLASFQGLDSRKRLLRVHAWRAFVTKLDPTGKTLWVYAAASPSSAGDGEGMDDLAVDASGNIVLAMSGLPSPDGATTGYAIVKLDSGGQPVFVVPSRAFAPADAVMQSVAVAPDGSIWSVAWLTSITNSH